jgi:hypothetical protein
MHISVMNCAIAVAAFTSTAAGQTQLAPQIPNDREQRQRAYAELRTKFFAGPRATAAEREAVRSGVGQLEEMTARLHDLMAAEIEDTVSVEKPSAQDVENAVKRLLGETALSEWDPAMTNTPVSELTQVGGAPALVAAYGMLRGANDALPKSRSYLEFYTLENGAWRLKAQANPDFDGCTFSGAAMDPGMPGQAWFLVWGKAFGDTGSRTKLRLYAFDGTSVKTIWQRDELDGGKVTATRNSVELDYSKGHNSLERLHEMLFITFDGLK